MRSTGTGYFPLTLKDGSTGYTRDGTFTVDANGVIGTAQGYTLKWNGSIPSGTEEVAFAGGTVMARIGTSWVNAGSIQLYDFSNPSGLMDIGSNVKIATPSSGAASASATNNIDGFLGDGSVISGSANNFNLSIRSGNGFMAVQMPDGSLAYTQDSTFYRDNGGRIVNSAGNQLVWNGQTMPIGSDFAFTRTGTAWVKVNNEWTSTTGGVSNVYRFPDATSLDRYNEQIKLATSDSGAANKARPGSAGYGQLLDASLESTYNFEQVGNSLTDLQNVYDEILESQTTNSARIKNLATASDRIDINNLEIKTMISKKEDVNVAEVYSLLDNQTTIYQKVIAIAGKLSTMQTLFDRI